MAPKALPSPEVLRQLLHYEPETGKLFWLRQPVSAFKDGIRTAAQKARMWNARFDGREAGNIDPSTGYVRIRVGGVLLYAHRIAILMVTGEWPTDEVDHEDGDVANNRITNLRCVSHAENLRNAKRRSDNSSGQTGVHYYERDDLWQAEIRVDGETRYLGRFATIEEATRVRERAEARLGFHPNHGR